MHIFVIGGTGVDPADPDHLTQTETLQQVCRDLGASFATTERHVAVLCSPFEDSADFHVLRGIAQAAASPTKIEIHFPDTPEVRAQLDTVVDRLSLSRVIRQPHYPPQSATREARQYAWLLSQLAALDSSHIVIAVGGREDGAANLLLLLAEGRQKPILPLPILGGAARLAFHRRRYELKDRLGDALEVLQDARHAQQLIPLAERLVDSRSTVPATAGISTPTPRFFVSYPRARPAEADHVETLLRRRRYQVDRDDSAFDAGHDVPARIREAVYASTVFIALWCKEYACSPWCADEFDIALERHRQGTLDLWIICTDATRIVPRAARDLLYYPVNTREELEGRLQTLLARLDTPHQASESASS